MGRKILGIDPGYGRLGYAVLENGALSDAGCLETPKEMAHEERLRVVGKHFKELIRAHKPEVLAMEKLFLNTNQKTAMRVAEARGTMLYLADGLEIREFSPPEIKLAVCGYGRADKKQVERMIRMIFKTREALNDDAIDAVAVAFTASGRI
ncbi:MAG: crossover junction endodeoxyribonuclease RuvC [Candidatus Niyogibacteria bacterium]|nr:MAG: crossover junction endodeoxyribonuclease RuvC [Candidatus Niyogibacteria bacterium]